MSIPRPILALPLMLILAACAAAPRDYTDPRALPTAEQIAAFGTIGFDVAGVTRPQEPAAPDSMSHLEKAGTSVGVGAAGAGIGALGGLSCGPIAPVCVPVFAAAFGLGGLVGSAIGTVPYRTAEQVNSADITLRNALLSVDLKQRLVELILARAPRTPSRNLRRIGYALDEGPRVIGDDDTVDTRILIAVPKFALVALNPGQKQNPDVRLEIVGEGRIFQDNDEEAPAFERRWLYDSPVHSYFEWAEDQGALVAAEIDLAIATLGAKIADDFLRPETETAAVPPVVVEGTSVTEAPDNDEEAPAFARRWLYDSPVHSYFEWAEDQGALVAAEIDLAVATLGAKIADDFLGPDTEMELETAAVEITSENEMPDNDGEEDDGGGLLAKAGSFFKSLFGSDPPEE